MGDFAGIPWGIKGQCCLILQVFPGVNKVLSNGDFAGIPWGKQGQCYLTPSGRFCSYSLGYTRSVLSNAKWDILQVFPGVNKASVV